MEISELAAVIVFSICLGHLIARFFPDKKPIEAKDKITAIMLSNLSK